MALLDHTPCHVQSIKNKSKPSKSIKKIAVFPFILCTLILVARDNAPKLPDGPRVKTSTNVEFVATGNNFDSITRYQDALPAAKKYLTKIHSIVQAIEAMEHTPEGQALSSQSKDMNTLQNEGNIFGGKFDERSTGLHECRSAGIAANTYWKVKANFITTETADQATANFNEAAVNCKKQINNPIEPTVNLVGPVEQIKPPFVGCLQIIQMEDQPAFSKWTCPATAIPPDLSITN